MIKCNCCDKENADEKVICGEDTFRESWCICFGCIDWFRIEFVKRNGQFLFVDTWRN